MPTPGKGWFHITFGTYGSWLPGDPRGWRSRNHKRHSSGDHRRPPPKGEHAGLHRYSQDSSADMVRLGREQRPVVGQSLQKHLAKLDHRLLVVSVSALHVHLLVELPRNRVKHEVGRCKRLASLALCRPGRLWARDCGIEPIHDIAHHRNAYQYIRNHLEAGAWVGTYRDGELPYSS